MLSFEAVDRALVELGDSLLIGGRFGAKSLEVDTVLILGGWEVRIRE